MLKKFSSYILPLSLLIAVSINHMVLFPKTSLAQRYNSSRYYYKDSTVNGPFLRLGFGYGIPYGHLGMNAEYMLYKYFSMTGALGYSPGGSGWIMGVRVYINEPERLLRPRISALYGTVSVLVKKYGPEEIYETDQGYAYGFGCEWKFLDSGKHSIDFDIIMTDYNVPPGYEKKGPSIKFSLGYGRTF